jgi:hypothetical protein
MTMDEKEIGIAIKEYLDRNGFVATGEVTFSASPSADCFDRLTGNHYVTAKIAAQKKEPGNPQR